MTVSGETRTRGANLRKSVRNRHCRFLMMIIVAVPVIGGMWGCVIDSNVGQDALAYLEGKYDEQFDIEQTDDDGPFSASAGVEEKTLAVSRANSQKPFVVFRDPDSGEFRDWKPCADWALALKNELSPTVREALGEDVQVDVNLLVEGIDAASEAPASGQPDLGTDARASKVTLGIGIPSEGEPDVQERAQGILSAWKTVQGTGATTPVLMVWFYRPGEGFDEYFRLANTPGLDLSWDADPSVIGNIRVTADDMVATTDDIVGLYDVASEEE